MRKVAIMLRISWLLFIVQLTDILGWFYGVVSESFQRKLYTDVFISSPCNWLHRSQIVHSFTPFFAAWVFLLSLIRHSFKTVTLFSSIVAMLKLLQAKLSRLFMSIPRYSAAVTQPSSIGQRWINLHNKQTLNCQTG